MFKTLNKPNFYYDMNHECNSYMFSIGEFSENSNFKMHTF